MLDHVRDVNSWDVVQALRLTEGDTPTVYFVLVDEGLDRDHTPSGRRYCPPATSTLTVTLDNIDDAKKLTRAAEQPFEQDPSIWSIDLLTTDKVLGTVVMRLKLTEPDGMGTKVTYGQLRPALLVDSRKD